MNPWSPACERNKEPILDVLRRYFTGSTVVLEIGSGTAQHAVYFARALPQLIWIATDIEPSLSGMRSRIEEAGLENLRGPLLLDVTAAVWTITGVDHVFSANTAHIMSWEAVRSMFAGVGRVLAASGCFVLYGPFNRDGRYTSESNRLFDEALRAEDPSMGLRDDRDLVALGRDCGLLLEADVAMPANNRTLVFRRA